MKKIKINYGKKVGVCSLCGINYWDIFDYKPAISPCGIQDCPHETKEFQKSLTKTVDFFKKKGIDF